VSGAPDAAGEVAAELRRRLAGLDLRLDRGNLRRYSRDQSPFRRAPAAALVARDAGEVAAAVEGAAELGVPVTPRAGGSGVAGGCLGEGLVIDTSELRGVEPAAAESVWCGAGETLDGVNAALAGAGREIGPDAISGRWARIGGLIATNACGSRSLAHGRFADALLEAEVVLADGGRAILSAGGGEPEAVSGRLAVARKGLAGLERWPRQPRQPGGYRLPQLAAGGGALALLPGSEGTLGVLTRARLRTVPTPDQRALTLVATAGLGEALTLAPELADSGASAVEMLDARLTAAARARGLEAIPPESGAALVVEHRGEGSARGAADAARAARGALACRPLAGSDAERAWTLRASALSLAGGGLEPLACFEDPAVPPRDAARFCSALLELLGRHRFEAIVYGHAGAGCLHVRPLADPREPCLADRLLGAAAAVCDLVGEWGGALTGEHGWGLSRSHLAPRALGPELYAGMEAVKRAFDPHRFLNPGVITSARDPRELFAPTPPPLRGA
jgi:FAD/FMN-containing dehydrogenase